MCTNPRIGRSLLTVLRGAGSSFDFKRFICEIAPSLRVPLATAHCLVSFSCADVKFVERIFSRHIFCSLRCSAELTLKKSDSLDPRPHKYRDYILFSFFNSTKLIASAEVSHCQ